MFYLGTRFVTASVAAIQIFAPDGRLQKTPPRRHSTFGALVVRNITTSSPLVRPPWMPASELLNRSARNIGTSARDTRAWPQSHDSRVGGHAHVNCDTTPPALALRGHFGARRPTPRPPRSHYASPSGRGARRRPSMAMMMHAVVAKQIYKPRTAPGQTLTSSCTDLAKP